MTSPASHLRLHTHVRPAARHQGTRTRCTHAMRAGMHAFRGQRPPSPTVTAIRQLRRRVCPQKRPKGSDDLSRTDRARGSLVELPASKQATSARVAGVRAARAGCSCFAHACRLAAQGTGREGVSVSSSGGQRSRRRSIPGRGMLVTTLMLLRDVRALISTPAPCHLPGGRGVMDG